MKKTLSNLTHQLFVSLLILCTSVALVQAQLSKDETSSLDGASRNTIEGAWMTVVTRRDCSTGAVIGSFNGLQTFNFGGTVAETGATPGGPSLRGPGHGIWARQLSDTFSSSFIFIRYNPDGTFAGWQKITSDHVLNETGDAWTATAAFEIIAPNGSVLNTGCATATGVRFQ